jgi:hypothetical protein
MVQKLPDMNAVACHTKHEAKFDGVQNVDWFHQHFEIDIQLGGTIGYEVRSLRLSVVSADTCPLAVCRWLWDI